ncbi:MAG: hypothetical protein HY804_07100 [Nitrospinae bacterium]|nr:hypothetical protein [Nitrospinota bacterium]
MRPHNGNAAILVESAPRGKAQAAGRAARSADAPDSGGMSGGILFVSAALLGGLAVLESHFQRHQPGFSFLGVSHQFGLLTQYEISSEPNRGIWLPMAMVGSGCFVVMMLYSLRKRAGFLMEFGSLRRWLDVHMFLGLLGALLVTAHTNLKIGGIVSISYWSMVIVAASGILGRYLYGWIPRRVSGQELELEDIRAIIARADERLAALAGESPGALAYHERIKTPPAAGEGNALAAIGRMMAYDAANLFRMVGIWMDLAGDRALTPAVKRRLFRLLRRKSGMIRARNFLSAAQRLLHYWHVFHKPLAITMFIVMFLHIAVYYVFRVQ